MALPRVGKGGMFNSNNDPWFVGQPTFDPAPSWNARNAIPKKMGMQEEHPICGEKNNHKPAMTGNGFSTNIYNIYLRNLW